MADRAAFASIMMMVVRSGKQEIFTTDLLLFKPQTRLASASEHSALLKKNLHMEEQRRFCPFPLFMMLLVSATSSAKRAEIFKEK